MMDYNKYLWKSCVLLFLLVISSCTGFSQNKDANKKLTFNTIGLYNEQLIRNIFLGNFLDIPFNRDAQTFSTLFNAYITAYSESNHCRNSLPADRIELTSQECDEWITYTNGWGVVVDKECTHWKSVKTGVFVSREMFAVKNELDKLQAVDFFGKVFTILTQKDPIGLAANLVNEVMSMKQDMVVLFGINDCGSLGLKRFEENLRLFALNKQPIVMGGGVTQKDRVAILSKDQDFVRLIDNLIYFQSLSWAVFKYESGYVSNVKTTLRDSNGLPAEMTADYVYKGWSGRSYGTVRVTFTDGLPECLYFFDKPTICRTADRKTVANYANGVYQKR